MEAEPSSEMPCLKEKYFRLMDKLQIKEDIVSASHKTVVKAI